jgi:DNA uptake protein ComE-like DNA-binding protein
MRRERGAVLIVTLGVLAMLVAIVTAIAASQRVDALAQANRMQLRRARLAADAGVQRAMAEIELLLQNQEESVNLTQNWAEVGQKGSESFVIGNESFRMEILDAASLININTASEQQLQRLPLTTEQIDSLLDWREAGLQPRPEGGKDEYYNQLPNPYNAKLGRLDSVEELLLVKGFTPETLYTRQDGIQSTVVLVQGGPEDQPILFDILTADSNSPASTGLVARINVNTATLQQLIQRGISAQFAALIIQRRNTQGTFANLGDVLRMPGISTNDARAVVDGLTVPGLSTEGKINVNTALEATLNSIPNMQPDITSAILSRQQSGITALSELFDVPGVTPQTMADLVDLVSTTSQTFIVRVIGTAGDATVALQATIGVQNNHPRLLKVQEMSFPDQWARWGWEQDTTFETVIMEAR